MPQGELITRVANPLGRVDRFQFAHTGRSFENASSLTEPSTRNVIILSNVCQSHFNNALIVLRHALQMAENSEFCGFTAYTAEQTAQRVRDHKCRQTFI